MLLIYLRWVACKKSFACGVEGTVQDREPMVGKWLCVGGWCSWFGNAPYGCK